MMALKMLHHALAASSLTLFVLRDAPLGCRPDVEGCAVSDGHDASEHDDGRMGWAEWRRG